MQIYIAPTRETETIQNHDRIEMAVKHFQENLLKHFSNIKTRLKHAEGIITTDQTVKEST